MSDESLGLQWASQPYEDAVVGVGRRMNLADRNLAARMMRNAFHIIGETLGHEWLMRERNKGDFLMLDDPEDADEDSAAAIEPVLRLFDLASEIEDARHVRGFDHLLVDLRPRSTYEALAELRAVNHMVRAGENAWFVDPAESEGPSFDAVVVLAGVEVAVEVKVKLPKPTGEYRPNLIVNSLAKARKQLPPAGPSLIYLQLGSPWTDDPATMDSVDETITTWLTKTRRVNGVLVMAERQFDRGPSARSRMRGSYYISNPRPRHAVEVL